MARLGRSRPASAYKIIPKALPASPGTGVTGAEADIAFAAPAGSVSAGAVVTGVVAAVSLAAPAGAPSAPVAVTGVTATAALAAPAGATGGAPVSVSGPTASVAIGAAAGIPYATALPTPCSAPQFPTVIVEAGFAPTDPALGALDLILDDMTFGILDTDELADDDTWTDISAYCQDGSVTRQSTRQQGPFVVYQGGTCTLTLNNSDGRFDPANLAGPYVAAGETQIRPMIPIRVRAVFNSISYPLFQGFATSWTPPSDNFGAVYDQSVLACGDAFRIFANVNLPTVGGEGANELSGARIERILEAAGWYSSARGMSVIDAGNSQMQAYVGGDTALDLLQTCADSEMGEIYIDAQGRFVFRQRDAILTETRSNTVQGVFGGQPLVIHPEGTEREATSLSRPDDDTTMANDIQATIEGSSNMQEATDAESVSRFLFPRTYQRTDLILTTDAEALQWANYVLVLGSSDEFRFDSVTITPGVAPCDLYPQALGRELGDRIQVWKRPPNVAPYSKDLFIRGIEHTFTPTWFQTVWTPQNAGRYSFFVLDDINIGLLDVDALAW